MTASEIFYYIGIGLGLGGGGITLGGMALRSIITVYCGIVWMGLGLVSMLVGGLLGQPA